MRVEYELIHDSLVSPILQWLGDDFWMAQQVCELLRLALPAWRERRRLLALDDLRLIHEHRQLVSLTAAELALIYATAVAYNESVADWHSQLSPAARLAVLRQLLKHNEAPVRRQAAQAVAEFARPRVATRLAQLALGDDEATVRSAAAASLAAIANQNAIAVRAALAKLVAQVTQPAQAERATCALVQVRDQAPVVHTQLPGQLRRPIRWQVWTKRWQRNQANILAATLRGLQAGFWGLGLGMGPLLALRSNIPVEANLANRLAFIFTGVALAGFIGAITAGSAAFTNISLRALQDDEHPWRTWLVTTLVGGALTAPPFVILGGTSPKDGANGQPALAGLLVGLVLVGIATCPPLFSPTWRIPAATLAGMLVFVLCFQLGWFAVGPNAGLAVLVGGAAGYGFALGFSRSGSGVRIIDD